MTPHLTYRIKKWFGPLIKRYEDWLISQGRTADAFILHQLIEEMDSKGFYDYHCTPFEARVACKRMWMDLFLEMVQGMGCPNLEDVGYAND